MCHLYLYLNAALARFVADEIAFIRHILFNSLQLNPLPDSLFVLAE